MWQPETYAVTLILMILSMICWGSWANTIKAAKGIPFQLFYWDYVWGVIIVSLAWGLTAGNAAGGTHTFFSDLAQADRFHVLYCLVAGAIFNVANLLLVAAIDIAGMAVAFPIGIGLALVIGSLLNYLLAPKGSALLLFGGVGLVLLAILVDAAAYKMREGETRHLSQRGIWISIVSGVLMGLFYPLFVKSSTGTASLGPYAAALVFSIGIALCSIPVNSLFMAKPIAGGPPVAFADYFKGRSSWHLWGVLGGALWGSGAVLNFVTSHAGLVGPAVSYSIGQGATMISAMWGIFVWKEFTGSPQRAKKLIGLMFLFFLAGLTAVALAPLH